MENSIFPKQDDTRSGQNSNRDGHDEEMDRRITTQNLSPGVSTNVNWEMKTELAFKDNAVSKRSVDIDESVNIQIVDIEAFSPIFIRQREEAINNRMYRSTIESWKLDSLQHLVAIMKTFSKGKSLIDRYWMIFYWIASNITYDTVAYFSKHYQDQSAEGVFQTKRGVCAGYATLYKYLCDQLQMPCEVINGCAKDYAFDGPEEAAFENNHAWNAVEIDAHWYLVESTWGAGHLNDRQEFDRELTSYYFLPRPDEMISHHLPEDDRWQLLEKPLNKSQFLRIPEIRPTFYELKLQLIPPQNQYFVQLEKGKPFALVAIRAPNDVQVTADLKLGQKMIDGGHRVIFDKKKQQYRCYFAPRTIGKYKITIYAKHGQTTIGTYHSAVGFALDITIPPDKPISYPKTWQWFFDFGLKILSPLDTHVIRLKNNEQFVQILIRTPSDIQVLGQLQNANGETIVCGNQDYYHRQKDYWRCRFTPNDNGIFEAVILAKRKNDSKAFVSVVSFQVIVNHVLLPYLSFPQTWQLFYDLNLKILYPIAQGIIVLNGKLRFAEIRIQAPDDVRLVGQFRNHKNEDVPGGKQVYYDHERAYWRCKFAPKHAGTFDAMILARKCSDSGDFISVVLFKIELKESLHRPLCFVNTTQLYHDLKLKVVFPLNCHNIVLPETTNYAEILLKIPNDVALLGQLINANKDSIPNADQVHYDRRRDVWCCKFAPNQNGLFDAVILAKKKLDPGPYSTALTFPIKVNHAPSVVTTFPQTWQAFYNFDLKIESPKSSATVPWIKNASYAEVLIHAPDDVQLSGRIEYNQSKIENGSLTQYDHERKLWQLLFAPERTGLHELIVFGKRTTDVKSSSTAVVKFNLNVTSLGKSMKFPMI